MFSAAANSPKLEIPSEQVKAWQASQFSFADLEKIIPMDHCPNIEEQAACKAALERGLQLTESISRKSVTLPGKDYTDDFLRIQSLLKSFPQLTYVLANMANVYLRNRYDAHTRIELAASAPTDDVTAQLDPQTKVLLIQIKSFLSECTAKRVRAALVQYPDARGVMLDLRGNTGGDLAEALKVADFFIAEYTDSASIPSLLAESRSENVPGSKRDNDLFYSEGRKISDLPLVVLQNAQTSSASEALAGAIKYFNRGLLVGDRSFGKALMEQVTAEFGVGPDHHRPVRRYDTVAYLYLGNGESSWQGVGLDADITVSNGAAAQAFIREEDIANSLPAVSERFEVSVERRKWIDDVQSCQKQSTFVMPGSDSQRNTGSAALLCMIAMPPYQATQLTKN